MRYHRTLFTALAIGACASLTGVPAQAQNVSPSDGQPTRLDQSADAKAGADFRVSELLGMNIENAAGDGVGEVKDIVLDADTGKVRYVAVTYGGFLGVGNKMFAVPFEAFQCQADPDDPESRQLILDVTEKQLEGATGFDEDNWPDFANRDLTDELDKRYGVERERPIQAQEGRRTNRGS